MENKLQVIINHASGEKKNQLFENISKKTLKIERLKIENKNLEEKINKIKTIVDKMSKPVYPLFIDAKETYIKLLLEKYNLKGVLEWEKEIISELIFEEISILTDLELISDNIKEIYLNHLKNVSKDFKSQDKEMHQEEARLIFEEMGIELDDDFDFDSINDPDFIKKIQQEFHEKNQKERENKTQQKVEKTDIDFQKLYKKLVKLCHPDLVKDTKEKETREEIIKEITAAWESRNYYNLILLWLKIDPNNSCELEKKKKNQKNIIKQLNEQIAILEYEAYRIKNEFEETAFYYKNFNAPREKTIETRVNKYLANIQEVTNRTHFYINKFQSTSNFKKELKDIRKRKIQQEKDAFNFEQLFYNQKW